MPFGRLLQLPDLDAMQVTTMPFGRLPQFSRCGCNASSCMHMSAKPLQLASIVRNSEHHPIDRKWIYSARPWGRGSHTHTPHSTIQYEEHHTEHKTRRPPHPVPDLTWPDLTWLPADEDTTREPHPDERLQPSIRSVHSRPIRLSVNQFMRAWRLSSQQMIS